MRTSLTLCLVASSALVAQAPTREFHPVASHAIQQMQSRIYDLGLDGNHTFAFRNIIEDADGTAHVRLDQSYRGVKVFEGEAIAHLRGGELIETTDALVRGLNLNPNPSIEAAEALAVAHGDLAPKGPYANPPIAELVFANVEREVPIGKRSLDSGNESTRTVTRSMLAYHVHAELENGPEETRHADYLISAHTGEILESWDTLHKAAAAGTGKSQWYGTVSLNTNSIASGFEMRDMTRGTGGTFGNNVTTNLNNGTSGNGTIFTDADNGWGDGLRYNGTAGMGANAQTAAVDGHRGMASTWDFYKNVFGRNGIDGTGKAAYGRMHYSTNYDNAFWSDSCFCMTYGDGNATGSVGEADLDTVGHEMSHGVTATTANLAYRKESGGLNEATSDIFGTSVEFWVLAANSTGAIIPSTAGIGIIKANYKLFENSWGHAYPNDALRWMHKPSRDGASPDFYSSTLGRLDVHYSSGVANHFFFLLAHGSQIDTLSENEQSPMTNGVTSITGIGNDKAARVWYKALTTYFTSTTTYAGARTATLNAARDLFGSTSTEYATVNKAWLAVNVK